MGTVSRQGGGANPDGPSEADERGETGERSETGEPYLTPRVLHLRHLVWAILLGWLVVAVVVVLLVRTFS